MGARQGFDQRQSGEWGQDHSLSAQDPVARSRSVAEGRYRRFYGTAEIHTAGPVYEEIWERLIQPEKDRDPQKKGFAVLIKVERAEDLDGKPLDIK